jgi:predicted nucleotidyltransferase
MLPGIDLDPVHLEILMDLLRLHLKAAEVWAFGSRINGQGHPGSDLDLVVRSLTNLQEPQSNLSNLRRALRESRLPFLIDLHDWARLPTAFRDEIEKNHRVLNF